MQSEWIAIDSFTVVIISMIFEQSMNNHWTEKERERDREIIATNTTTNEFQFYPR